MLISMDKTGKTKSVYKCDRCGEIIENINGHRYRISAHKPKGRKTTVNGWDFCRRCYLILCKGVAKGVKNKNDDNIQC